MLVLASVRVTTRARPLAKLWLQTRTIKSAPVLSAATETSSAGVPTWRSTMTRSRVREVALKVLGQELLIHGPGAAVARDRRMPERSRENADGAR